MLVHVTVIFRNLIFVCITIKDKLIKHLYNSHLRKLPIAHGEVSVMVFIAQLTSKMLQGQMQIGSLKPF